MAPMRRARTKDNRYKPYTSVYLSAPLDLDQAEAWLSTIPDDLYIKNCGTLLMVETPDVNRHDIDDLLTDTRPESEVIDDLIKGVPLGIKGFEPVQPTLADVGACEGGINLPPTSAEPVPKPLADVGACEGGINLPPAAEEEPSSELFGTACYKDKNEETCADKALTAAMMFRQVMLRLGYKGIYHQEIGDATVSQVCRSNITSIKNHEEQNVAAFLMKSGYSVYTVEFKNMTDPPLCDLLVRVSKGGKGGWVFVEIKREDSQGHRFTGLGCKQNGVFDDYAKKALTFQQSLQANGVDHWTIVVQRDDAMNQSLMKVDYVNSGGKMYAKGDPSKRVVM